MDFLKLFYRMEKYRCTVCEYIYDPESGDPENGIDPGTAFEDLPDDWVCPVCGGRQMGIRTARSKLKRDGYD